MQLEPNNRIIELCAEGMNLEGEGKNEEAAKVFLHAWEEASTDMEKLIAAHYVARHQETIGEKLNWDQTALDLALKIDDDKVQGAFPSLYLNVAKGYEDLEKFNEARHYYTLALSVTNFLLDDGYGKMIRKGIESGLERVREN